jgi:hypothetical protein
MRIGAALFACVFGWVSGASVPHHVEQYVFHTLGNTMSYPLPSRPCDLSRISALCLQTRQCYVNTQCCSQRNIFFVEYNITEFNDFKSTEFNDFNISATAIAGSARLQVCWGPSPLLPTADNDTLPETPVVYFCSMVANNLRNSWHLF